MNLNQKEPTMPIGFARLEFVKRSSGKNACAKAAYNSRSRIEFQGTEFHPHKIYDWSKSQRPIYHEVFLPDNVKEKFKSPELLWNTAEQKDVRKNSQPAFEMVLALPDDKVFSLEDRKYLATTFVLEHFVKNGLAAQVDIHSPDQKVAFSENGEVEQTKDHNWHAHVLTTTRRFKENGQELSDHKARDMMPNIRNGKVISGPNWGKLWAQHQNAYFEQKGLSLRVEEPGIVSQKHLGPVRMRGRAFSLLEENSIRIDLNKLESEDPIKVLNKLTETKNIFTSEDVDYFLYKHVDHDNISTVREAFWKLPLVQLLDLKNQKPLNKFTIQSILDEERQTLRLADKLVSKPAFALNVKQLDTFSTSLNDEQKEAFAGIVNGKKLSCLEGYAGTGKSYLLNALRKAYQENSYNVRAFGPDTATAIALKEVGFVTSENVYRFLFALKNDKRQISKNKEIWILDEAGKLGTAPLLELLKFAHKYGAQLILSGDSKQIPSVSRGGMFTIFSQKYGSQNLQEIQRQESQIQREIAKKLAKGEMGSALDAIVREGDIKWQPSKEASLESLITAWAHHRIISPSQSSLILAHSNREVKALNELARLYRKEAGELPSKEYACDTFQGTVYISCGDRIEFRQKSQELGVSNGTEGILIKASEDKFTVQISEEGKKRTVTFNPQKYRTFQLGYATTYYRAQGRTMDRAFVLHSPLMNKELFYVGLTRHVKKAEIYISEQDAKTLSDVKRGAFRSSLKESTINYLTYQDLEKGRLEKIQNEKIHQLKSSESILAKAKGYGFDAWINIRSKVHKAMENYQDKRPNIEFFNPDLTKHSLEKGKVVKIVDEEIPSNKEAIKTDYKTVFSTKNEQSLPKIQPKERFSKIKKEHKDILDKYFQSVDQTSSFYTIIQAQDEKDPITFKDWQRACGQRNALAYEVVSTLSEKDNKKIFKGKSYEILHDRAAKHLSVQRKQDSLINYDEKLKDHLDVFLHKLFPEGPTARDRDGFRFGSKGSLKVVCSGSKKGSFFDFEQHEGGGPIQLIQKELFCSKSEALSWAKDFLGEAHTIEVPPQFHTKAFISKKSEWISMKPDPKNPAPTLGKLFSKLASNYKETMRHTYRDEEGNVLFYTVRLEEKNNPGKKIVIPVSFGCNPESNHDPKWEIKGYRAEKNPLYNLHLLKEYPHSKVLIVEGEKTADAALQKFPKEKMICLSWSGGAGSATKADWSYLKGRDVIIWPDNDKAGFEASEAICKSLQKVGVKSLREVDKQLLVQELPPKWDLADKLPGGKDARFIDRAILRALKKFVETPYKDLNTCENKLEVSQKEIDRHF